MATGDLSSAHSAIILVVEDDPLLRMMAIDFVEEAGFESVEAGNADEAVRILESRTDIRIVFTDIDMPGSLDGMKLAAAIRDRWPPIDIIMTSGHNFPSLDQIPARAVFFPKPYDPDRVIEAMRTFTA